MAPDSSGDIRPKCTNFQVLLLVLVHDQITNAAEETVTFCVPDHLIEAWSLVPDIDARIPIKFIMPPYHPNAAVRTSQFARELVWMRKENTTHVVLEKGSHMVR